jgi:Tfp pilus assembly protein PilV
MSRGRQARPVCTRVSADACASARRRMARQAGFTLLEVALAVLVLGTELVALTRMLVIGRLCADADAKRVVALQILREQAELVRARGYDGAVNEAAATVGDHPGYSRSVTATYVGGGLKSVTVTVTWNSPTGQIASESVGFFLGDSVLPVRTWEVR